MPKNKKQHVFWLQHRLMQQDNNKQTMTGKKERMKVLQRSSQSETSRKRCMGLNRSAEEMPVHLNELTQI